MGLQDGDRQTGPLLSGSFSYSEEIQTVSRQTNKRFQLMKRARKKIKQREM